MTAMIPDFDPPLFMRSAIMQTFLASQKLRKRGPNPMLDAAQSRTIECRDGVRLLGSYSAHPDSRGTMIFLHGWEGSQDSTYVMCCARYLYSHGYSVFRLNLRDHGDSHHLNEGLFHGPLFDEVMDGVRYAAALERGPSYLTGFSLGGNYALRVLRAAKTQPIDNLAHVFAISPVVNPLLAAPFGDRHALIKRYFLKKWRRSLAKKQAAFPELYDFSQFRKAKTIMGLSDALIAAYLPNYPDRPSFFNAYRIAPDDLKDAKTPYTIIMADDDPIVPAEHLDELKVSDTGQIIRLTRGGHNGFFDSITGPTWYDRYILNVISDVAGEL